MWDVFLEDCWNDGVTGVPPVKWIADDGAQVASFLWALTWEIRPKIPPWSPPHSAASPESSARFATRCLRPVSGSYPHLRPCPPPHQSPRQMIPHIAHLSPA